ncbi:DUF5776 domain-containing protein [Lentilactobacillus parafarraginis]|uniref:Beta-fructosidase n=2 Tax=Lentilactobacillus parafarraginis TaxID=390842 RepID=A0A0R1YRA6_9LACO|nr:DUF5776 domain-containing protein [Lentilactobacillus parafarraginis]KRM41795.1 beta-fructosidase [Lentilactobacillus parafarraginis DSM 18390 = JCM 14109]
MNKKYRFLLTSIFAVGVISVGTYAGVNLTPPMIIQAATVEDGQLPSKPTKLTQFPPLTNFYADTNGARYIYTNLTATLPLYPYNSERKDTDSELYGFYVVLPKTLTMTLADAQQSARQYLEKLQSPAYNYSITSLTAYDLGTTKDGTDRQVFYFQPNDGANNKQATTVSDSSKWPVFNLNVKTGTDKDAQDNPTILLNANNEQELKDDVLFAGTNDFQSHGSSYPTLTASGFIDGAPDQYIAGISYDQIQKTLTYVSSKSISVRDQFVIRDAVTHQVINQFPIVGQNESTIKVQDIINNLSKYGVSLDGYKPDTLKLYKGDVSDSTGLAPIDASSSLTYTPSIWGDSQTESDGQTYTFFVNSTKEGQIDLADNPVYIIGNEWDPKSYIKSATDVDGSKVDPKNIEVTGVSSTPTKVGVIQLTYSFKDKNGNSITKTTNVDVRNAKGSLTLKNNPTYTLGTKWDPKSYIESATDANGAKIDSKDIQLSGDTEQPTKTGTVSLTYSFKDINGNEITKQTSVKVLNADGILTVKDNPIYIVGSKWDPKSYIESAIDVDGSKVDDSKIDVSGALNAPTKLGKVTLTYTFKDQNGKLIKATTNVDVRNAKGSLTLKNNPTYTLGTKWDPKSYIESAIDANGTKIDPKNIQVSGDSKRPTKTGTVHLTYTFKDVNGNEITKSVDVKVNSAPSNGGSGNSTVISTPSTGSPSSSNSSSSSSSSSNTTSSIGTVAQPDLPNYAAQKGAAIYAIKPIYLYRATTLKKANRIAKYPRTKRVNRAEFVVKGYKRDAAGKLRYKVQQYNPYTRKYVRNRQGYITASTKYVQNAYYAMLPKQRVITVINHKGVIAYHNVSLAKKAKAYKKGTHLRVKHIVDHGLTSRFQLENGTYITGNKKFVIAGKY